MVPRPIVPVVVTQHIEDLGLLWNARRTMVRSANVALRHLARLDERLSAHQDGCVLAGSSALGLAGQVLADVTAPAVFTAATIALSVGDRDGFERAAAKCEAVPDSYAGLPAAMAWVSPALLSGIAVEMLKNRAAFRRRAALDGCRLHSVRPTQLEALQTDSDPGVRAAAIRLAGAVGGALVDFRAFPDQSDPAAFWYAWSRVLNGHRGTALEVLTSFAQRPGPLRRRAFRLALQALDLAEAHKLLRDLAAAAADKEWLIEGAGIVGDPAFVPWLISHMAEETTGRAAGEAFTLITGVDLALHDLERKPPEDFDSGPNDDPDDPDIDMDADDGLPWPDPARIQAWWDANHPSFQAGVRHFMGYPVGRENCLHVLEDGYQRQRSLAAHYLCLLEPGTPLFNTSAPARRQRRLLAAL